jgi:hypothetical protein
LHFHNHEAKNAIPSHIPGACSTRSWLDLSLKRLKSVEVHRPTKQYGNTIVVIAARNCTKYKKQAHIKFNYASGTENVKH